MGNLASLASLFENAGRWVGSHYVKKGFTGGWSKWGGGRYNLKKEEIEDEWYCQSCATRHPKEIPPYIYQNEDGLSLRVCAICYAEKCEVLEERIDIIRISLQTIHPSR